MVNRVKNCSDIEIQDFEEFVQKDREVYIKIHGFTFDDSHTLM